MTAIKTSKGGSPRQTGLRFGREDQADDGGRSVQWLLKRNCSLGPREALFCWGALSIVSLGIASMFWWHGLHLVMPFAWLEVVALGFAWLVYARHATDSESIRLHDGRLTVEHCCGRRTDRVEFWPEVVRIEPQRGDGSLIELSGQGRRIAVGRFVRPEQRRALADELRWALRRSPAWAA